MESNQFFPPHDGISLRELASHLGAELLDESAGDRRIRSVSPVARASEGQICFLRSRKTRGDLATCRASAVICDAAIRSMIPEHIPILLTATPETAFAIAGALLHPNAMRPGQVVSDLSGVHPAAHVDPTA